MIAEVRGTDKIQTELPNCDKIFQNITCPNSSLLSTKKTIQTYLLKKKKNYSLKTLETSTLQSDALQKCNFTSTDYNSEVGLNLKNRFS